MDTRRVAMNPPVKGDSDVGRRVGVSIPTWPSLAAPPGESNAAAAPGSRSVKNLALSAVNAD
jgi:hypothetical protein